MAAPAVAKVATALSACHWYRLKCECGDFNIGWPDASLGDVMLCPQCGSSFFTLLASGAGRTSREVPFVEARTFNFDYSADLKFGELVTRRSTYGAV